MPSFADLWMCKPKVRYELELITREPSTNYKHGKQKSTSFVHCVVVLNLSIIYPAENVDTVDTRKTFQSLPIRDHKTLMNK